MPSCKFSFYFCLDFFSRKDSDFTLQTLLDKYDACDDLPTAENDLDSLTIQHLTSALKTPPTREPYELRSRKPISSAISTDAANAVDESDDTRLVADRAVSEVYLDSFANANQCSVEHNVIDLCRGVFNIDIDEFVLDLPVTEIVVNKAKRIYDRDNPSLGMLERDPELAGLFDQCTRDEVDGGIADGSLSWLTEEERIAGGYVEYRPIVVYKTKRDRRRKCRLTFSGNDDPPEMFDPDDLFAPSLDEHFHKFITAFAVYHDMDMRTTDVKTCFRSHNSWDTSKYPRKICVRLTPYVAGGDVSRLVAFNTCTYGARDAPGQWNDYSEDVLVKKGGMKKLRETHAIFYKLSGEKGLYIVMKVTDDINHIYTKDADGQVRRYYCANGKRKVGPDTRTSSQ